MNKEKIIKLKKITKELNRRNIEQQESVCEQSDINLNNPVGEDTQTEIVIDLQEVPEDGTEENSTEEISNNSTEINAEQNAETVNNTEPTNYISLFEAQREKFAGDLNEYIFLLQEEIKNIREKM